MGDGWHKTITKAHTFVVQIGGGFVYVGVGAGAGVWVTICVAALSFTGHLVWGSVSMFKSISHLNGLMDMWSAWQQRITETIKRRHECWSLVSVAVVSSIEGDFALISCVCQGRWCFGTLVFDLAAEIDLRLHICKRKKLNCSISHWIKKGCGVTQFVCECGKYENMAYYHLLNRSACNIPPRKISSKYVLFFDLNIQI